MKKGEAKFCCSIEQCAVALGYVFPKQRNRAAAIRLQVRQWSEGVGLPKGCPPWPAQGKNGYWDRKQVVALKKWLAPEKVKGAAKPDEAKQPTSNSQRPTANAGSDQAASDDELPVQDKPAAEGDLFGEVSDEEKFRQRLAFHLDIYLNPKKHQNPLTGALRRLTVDEKAELRQYGLLPKLKGEDEGADDNAEDLSINIGGGVRGVANYINRNYPWVPCHHMKVQRWIASDELPSGCREPFPAAYDGAGRWRKVQVDAWVTKYFPKPAQGQELAVNIDSYREVMERRRLDHEEWVRQQERAATDKNYVRVDVLLDYAAELGRAVFRVPYGFEKELVRLFAELPLVTTLAAGERERLVESVRVLAPRVMKGICDRMEAAVREVVKRQAEEVEQG